LAAAVEELQEIGGFLALPPGAIPLGIHKAAAEEFAAFIRADLEKWSRVAAATGLKR